jgi:hypothetical protein
MASLFLMTTLWKSHLYHGWCKGTRHTKYQEVLGRTNRLLSCIEKDASNNSSLVAHVFVAAVTFLPSYSLATIEGETYSDTD